MNYFLSVLASGLFYLAALTAGAQDKTYFFNFGSRALSSAIYVLPTNLYSDAVGYGFEPGASLIMTNGSISSTNPFYFSV